MKYDNPIAIVAARYDEGRAWARHNLSIKEITISENKIVDISGQIYYVITKITDCQGRMFAYNIVLDGADIDVIELAARRIR